MAQAKIWKRKAQHFINGRRWKPTALANVPNVKPTNEMLIEYGACLTHEDEEKRRWTKARKEKLTAELESMLLAFDCSSNVDNKGQVDRFKCNLPPSYYHEAVLMGTEIDSLYQGISFWTAKPQDFDGTFDVSMCTPGNEDSKWQLFRFRSVPMKWARGYRLTSKYVAELSTTWIDENGEYTGQTNLMNWTTDDEWRYLEVNTKEDVNAWKQVKVDQDITVSNVCKTMLGMQFSRDMIWQVMFQFESAKISVFCDMAAAGAVFKDRDVDSGMSRRSALRHWVSDHLRRVPGENNELTEVVRHLRGRVPFRWHGIDCELVVAKSDVDMCERLKQERESRKIAAKRTPVSV